jgi:biopolymer transport protein ExbD
MPNWDVLYVGEGRQENDLDETEVRRLLTSGELAPEDCLRRTGETRWRRVSDLRNKSAKAAEEERKRQEREDEEKQEIGDVPPPMMAAPPIVGGVPGAVGTAASPMHAEDDIVSWTPQLHVDELDMTPMVDVVLLLLLFFMVTASYMMQKVIEIPKPNPEKSRATAKTRNELMKEYIMVEIDERNQFSVEDEPLKGATLKNAIERAKDETKKTKMFVIAEGACFHGSIVAAFDAATEAKMEAPVLLSVRTDD